MNENYYMSKIRFEGLARSFGIGALVCAIFFSSIPFIPIGFGFLSILFAILSKGYSDKLAKAAKNGLISGILAIIVTISILGFTVFRIMTDSEYRQSIIDTSKMLYGDTYEQDYGIDIEDLFNQYIPEIKK